MLDGASLHAEYSDRSSPLHLAAQRGNVGIVAYLLSLYENKNVRIMMRDHRGRTVLHHAVESARAAQTIATLRSFLPRETIHTYDNIGRSPLHHAVYYDNLPAVETLLSLKICAVEELARVDHAGLTPLDVAKKRKHKALGKFLKEQKRNIPNQRLLHISKPKKDELAIFKSQWEYLLSY
jgi:ankyrin repeat protein